MKLIEIETMSGCKIPACRITTVNVDQITNITQWEPVTEWEAGVVRIHLPKDFLSVIGSREEVVKMIKTKIRRLSFWGRLFTKKHPLVNGFEPKNLREQRSIKND